VRRRLPWQLQQLRDVRGGGKYSSTVCGFLACCRVALRHLVVCKGVYGTCLRGGASSRATC
jgi:hypothetical protein